MPWKNRSITGASLDAAIKHPAVHREVTRVVAVDEASAEIVCVERAAMEERREQTQCLGTIVAPGPRRRSAMGTPEAGRRFWLETPEWWECRCATEFIGNADGVTDEKAAVLMLVKVKGRIPGESPGNDNSG